MLIINDHSGERIVEAITRVVTAIRNFARWDTIGELRTTCEETGKQTGLNAGVIYQGMIVWVSEVLRRNITDV